jgi:hypothetical protein
MTTEHRKFDVQVEEDIEEARWLKPEEFLSGDYKMFHSIRDMVLKFMEFKKNVPI